MAYINVTTSDSILNGYLASLKSSRFGDQARSPLANSLDRCYTLAILKAGSPRGGVTRAVINEHINRIRNAVYGEEVRDALKTGLTLCYSARGISLSGTENTYLTNMINAQLGEDLMNSFLRVIARCCQDIRA